MPCSTHLNLTFERPFAFPIGIDWLLFRLFLLPSLPPSLLVKEGRRKGAAVALICREEDEQGRRGVKREGI